MPQTLSIEDYDIILDALDNEDTNTILKCFQKFELEPETEMVDAPRYGNNDIEVNTYLDYILSYNLTEIIDVFIDELNLEITDEIIVRTLELQNIDTYNYLCNLGYTPQEKTLKYAVKIANSSIIYTILENDKDLIEYIDNDDIEYLYDSIEDALDTINEETVETIRVLLNYNINIALFKNMLYSLKENINDSKYDDSVDKDIVIEIIDLLENY